MTEWLVSFEWPNGWNYPDILIENLLHTAASRSGTRNTQFPRKWNFAIICDADNTAAIQPFLSDDKVNSICHALHILEKQSDFEHYFPKV